MLSLLAILLAAAPQTPSTAPASDDAQARSIRTIEIDEARAKKLYRVRAAPGIPTLLEFPEAFSTPIMCGDCVEEPSASASAEAVKAFETSPALFTFTTFPAQHSIAFKPKQYAVSSGGTVPDDEFETTMAVKLESGITVTLMLTYAAKSQADARVVFSLPNRPAETRYVREAVAKEKTALETAYAKRVEDGVRQGLLTAFLESHQCAPQKARVRSNNLVLEATELCRFGTRLLVRFTVENRRNTPAKIGDVQLQGSLSGATPAPLPDAGRTLTSEDVPFGTTVTGVYATQLPTASTPAAHFTLSVFDSTGQTELRVPLDF